MAPHYWDGTVMSLATIRLDGTIARRGIAGYGSVQTDP